MAILSHTPALSLAPFFPPPLPAPATSESSPQTGPAEGPPSPQLLEPLPCRAPPRRKKKKKYLRHAKPPYTYLAMIALVIQAAPGKRLKLAQIIKEIGSLFPFFQEDYHGWKDSIRHNLSSNPCFHKVLKNPKKPQAKGNFWAVDVSLVPAEALRLQNTAVVRQGGGPAAFPQDLAPYVLHGRRFKERESPPELPATPNSAPDPAKTQGSFDVHPLLRDFQETPPPSHPPLTMPLHAPRPLRFFPAPQPLRLPPARVGGSESSGEHPCWGTLPTSYSRGWAPNVVAPVVLPCYSCPPGTHWGLVPGPRPRPWLSRDLGALLQAVPPNKSVSDIRLTHPRDLLPPNSLGPIIAWYNP
ncbi:forkhead box protein H1 [Ornithorhynchus anatinus]|uniref:forkhead box protein H1 n=1 Tax=Ornithorhynchus anatinus TaxID=9258 RepID=UPI0010A865F4|nr:forkhead box protein H1 [Ornithorhynchus anatinus]